MTDETKQTAVDETNVSATPDTAVDSAQQDDIEALLAEFDQRTQVASPRPEPKVDTTPEPVIARRLEQLEQRYIQEDVKKVSDTVFEGLELSDRTKTGWLDAFVRETPAAKEAYLKKDIDPRTWNRWQAAIKKEAQKEFATARKVDAEATADREAVAAAVRGASTKVAADPPPQLGRMSDSELRDYTLKNWGFA